MRFLGALQQRWQRGEEPQLRARREHVMKVARRLRRLDGAITLGEWRSRRATHIDTAWRRRQARQDQVTREEHVGAEEDHALVDNAGRL